MFAEPSGDPTVAQYEQALREGGAKMGADAVVVVYDRMQVVGTMVTGPWWAPAARPSSAAWWWAWRSATRGPARLSGLSPGQRCLRERARCHFMRIRIDASGDLEAWVIGKDDPIGPGPPVLIDHFRWP